MTYVELSSKCWFVALLRLKNKRKLAINSELYKPCGRIYLFSLILLLIKELMINRASFGTVRLDLEYRSKFCSSRYSSKVNRRGVGVFYRCCFWVTYGTDESFTFWAAYRKSFRNGNEFSLHQKKLRLWEAAWIWFANSAWQNKARD